MFVLTIILSSTTSTIITIITITTTTYYSVLDDDDYLCMGSKTSVCEDKVKCFVCLRCEESPKVSFNIKKDKLKKLNYTVNNDYIVSIKTERFH